MKKNALLILISALAAYGCASKNPQTQTIAAAPPSPGNGAAKKMRFGASIGTGASSMINYSDFKTWFSYNHFDGGSVTDCADQALAGLITGYLIQCACPAGTVINFTDGCSVPYTWLGSLGLAQNYCYGQLPSAKDQELVSACMEALVSTQSNTNAQIVSVAGDAEFPGLARTAREKALFWQTEGAFFGDITKESPTKSPEPKLYACNTGIWDNIAYAEAGRGCTVGNCDPIDVAGPSQRNCSSVCTCSDSATCDHFTSCTDPNGKVWSNPITTRLPAQGQLGAPYQYALGPSPQAISIKSNNANYGVSSAHADLNYAQGCIYRTQCPKMDSDDTDHPEDGYHCLPQLRCKGGFGNFRTELATNAESWVKIPEKIDTAPSSNTLLIMYSNGDGTAQAKVSVGVPFGTDGNISGTYTTVSFPNTGGWDKFKLLRVSLTFPLTQFSVVIKSLGNNTPAPALDWIAIIPE